MGLAGLNPPIVIFDESISGYCNIANKNKMNRYLLKLINKEMQFINYPQPYSKIPIEERIKILCKGYPESRFNSRGFSVTTDIWEMYRTFLKQDTLKFLGELGTE